MPKKPKKGSIYERPGKQDKDEKVNDESREQFLDESEEHIERPEEVKKKMHVGEKEVNVYTSEGREELIEEGEIAGWEEGFSEGEASSEAHCGACGSALGQKADNVVEREINHVRYLFCCKECAAKGVDHAKKK